MKGYLAALGLLTVIVGSGCVSSPGIIFIPPPTFGEEYHYQGPDGSSFIVRVVDTQSRYDAYKRAHDTIVLNFTFQPEYIAGSPNDARYRYYFEEAVDLHKGLTVQQTESCGYLLLEGCHQDRWSVLFDTSGLPGGLGASPHWGTSLSASGTQVLTQHVLGNITELNYQTKTIGTHWGDCLELRADHNDHWIHYPRGLPWNVITGPFLLCDGYSLPVEFVAAYHPIAYSAAQVRQDPAIYRLVEYIEGGAPAPSSATDGWEEAKSLVPLVEAPNYPLNTPEVDWGFTLQEAHEFAMQHSGSYNVLFQSGAVIARTAWHGGDLMYEGPLEKRYIYIRSITLSDNEGSTYTVEMRKTDRETLLLGNSSEVELAQEGPDFNLDPVPDWPSEQASPRSALELGSEITGQEHAGKSSSIRTQVRMTTSFSPNLDIHRTNGHDLLLHYEDPNPGILGGGFSAPMRVVIDGPTGALIAAARQPHHPPFGPDI